MLDDEPVEPRKLPSQARARATFDAIIEATARILASDGVEALNTNRIAEVAGVSVGSLYQYFPNKASIVAQLVELELERDLAVARQSMDSLSEVPLRSALKAIVTESAARARDTQGLHAGLLPLVDLVDRRRLVGRRVNEFHALLVSFLWTRRDELRPRFRADREQLEHVVWITSQMIQGSLNAAKVERPEMFDSPHLTGLSLNLLDRELLAASPDEAA